jgi:sulfur relay (sulfurtransferase) DsrF/TusC family protein
MPNVTMILRKPPYGDINAAEAVRHALGGVSGDWKVSLILIDGGVLLARSGQDDVGTGFTNLEATLKDCCDMGIDVYADNLSLYEHSLKKEDIVPNVQIKNESEIASLIKTADKTLIF